LEADNMVINCDCSKPSKSGSCNLPRILMLIMDIYTFYMCSNSMIKYSFGVVCILYLKILPLFLNCCRC
jgi:hypothetical protein